MSKSLAITISVISIGISLSAIGVSCLAKHDRPISEFNNGSSAHILGQRTNAYIPPNCIHPFDGELIPIGPLPVSDIIGECNLIGKQFGYKQLTNPPGKVTYGCSIGGKDDPQLLNTCYIVLDGTIDTYNHELAHCNGWPADHPAWFSCEKKKETTKITKVKERKTHER